MSVRCDLNTGLSLLWPQIAAISLASLLEIQAVDYRGQDERVTCISTDPPPLYKKALSNSDPADGETLVSSCEKDNMFVGSVVTGHATVLLKINQPKCRHYCALISYCEKECFKSF